MPIPQPGYDEAEFIFQEEEQDHEHQVPVQGGNFMESNDMTPHRRFLTAILATALVAAGSSASLLAKNGDAPAAPSLTLYSAEGMKGEAVTVTRSTPNLQSVPASEGFDGTANDFAWSLRSVGKWQVCMDAAYETDCLTVDGDLAILGERGGSISSVRYLGPSGKTKKVASATAAPATSAPLSQPAKPDDWQPMYNVDLYGNDLREIAYQRAGSDWRTCKASCDADGQCKAWTYVEPGRTPYGECFLKSPVPEASTSECCISGVKGAASAQGQTGDAAINLGLGRIGEAARRAAEDEVTSGVERKVRDAFGKLFGN